MDKKTLVAVAAVAVAGVMLAAAGCTRGPLPKSQVLVGGDSSAVSAETTSAPLGDAKRMVAKLRVGIGELQLSSVPSSTAAFTGRFDYEPADWKPDVAFSVESVDGTPTARLFVDQPADAERIKFGETRNAWDIGLASGVPTDLSLKLGVGDSKVDLSDVDVRTLEVVTGVGVATIDLSGPRSASMSGTITSGVGELTLRLPKDVGVRVSGGGDGLGDLSSHGFNGEGNELTNDAWSGTGPKIDLKIVRGVGDVKLELVE